MKKVFVVSLTLVLLNFNVYSQNNTEAIAAGVGALAAIALSAAAIEEIKESFELEATQHLLSKYPNFSKFSLQLLDFNAKKWKDISSVSIVPYYVQTFEFDNDNNAIAEEKFVLFAFTSKNWVNEYGTHYDKVMWHLFTREQWLDLMTNYVMLASGFDNKNEIKNILVDGKVTNTALKGKNRKENINFISMSGDLYLTKDFNEKFKIVYNERSFGLFLKESNNLVQLSRNDLIKIHNVFFHDHWGNL